MIGAGGIAARHLEALGKEPGVEIAGHLARHPQSARGAASRWGGRPFESLDDLLADGDLDAVWVTVPPHAHGEIELALIERRIPMFVEKPLSADRETARRIARAVEESGLVTAVGYQWRALDTLPRLREALKERPARMVSGSWQGSLPEPGWWRRVELSGGQMVEQATHLFDLARYLLGEATVLHAAVGDNERSDFPEANVAVAAAATLRFQGGALGNFTATSLLPWTGFVGLQLICQGLLVTLTRESVIYSDAKGRREEITGNDPFEAVDRAFLQAVGAGDPSLVHSSYADAMKTHELVLDVAEAAGEHGSGER
ncbi:MAG TPA: Gfo/Idh/MocA family oxidoreductase [Trueperaceae bacterium]